MPTPIATTTDFRPVRELVSVESEEPIKGVEVLHERRQGHRFARSLPGSAVLHGEEHAVTCMDIGYSGMKITVPSKVAPARDDQVIVTIEMGGRSYRDRYYIVHWEPTSDGTAIHLSMG